MHSVHYPEPLYLRRGHNGDPGDVSKRPTVRARAVGLPFHLRDTRGGGPTYNPDHVPDRHRRDVPSTRGSQTSCVVTTSLNDVSRLPVRRHLGTPDSLPLLCMGPSGTPVPHRRPKRDLETLDVLLSVSAVAESGWAFSCPYRQSPSRVAPRDPSSSSVRTNPAVLKYLLFDFTPFMKWVPPGRRHLFEYKIC